MYIAIHYLYNLYNTPLGGGGRGGRMPPRSTFARRGVSLA